MRSKVFGSQVPHGEMERSMASLEVKGDVNVVEQALMAHRLKSLVLKLRWMRLDQEAEEVSLQLVANCHGETIPIGPLDTD